MPSRANPIAHLQAVIAAQRDIMRCGFDLQRVMDVTTARTGELTASTAVIELREGDEMVYRSASPEAASTLGVRLSVHTSLSGAAVREACIQRCDDSELDPRVDRAACKRVGARSMLCVPLMNEGEAVGVLKVYAPEAHYFHDEDVSTLELMVGFIASATAAAVAQTAMTASEQRFRALAERASDAIVSADEQGLITFWNASAQRTFGYVEQEILGRPFTHLMPDRYSLSQDMARGRFDPARLEHVFGKPFELSGRRKDGSEFPVEVSSWVSKIGRERFFTSIIRDISERKRMEAVVLTLSRTDHLTGLLNRRAGEEALQHELAHARRHGRDLSLLLVDIDHFKQVNDSVGHAGGDDVLRRVSELIGARIRGSDVAIRWGGEEFLMILPETGVVGAQGLAESLRMMVAEATFAGPRVTISVGGASLMAAETLDEVISRADQKLYEAKRGGRNAVRI